MNGISAWAIAGENTLSHETMANLCEKQIGNFRFAVWLSDDSLYIQCEWPKGKISFRAAYTPDSKFELQQSAVGNGAFTFALNSTIGLQEVSIEFIKADFPTIRYTNTLTPAADLFFPYWPRDIIVAGGTRKTQAKGEVHVKQVGTRSGLLHVTLQQPAEAAFLYFQNLSNLAKYCEDTKTSAGETVGGQWPEIGFSLPATKDQPLKSNVPVVISDAFVAFDKTIATNEASLSKQYLNLLASTYLLLPKPGVRYSHWPDILEKGLKDLIDSPGCWSQVNGHGYFNAYVSDYNTPPEIMVQLAVLMPIVDYMDWSGKKLDIAQTIKKGLPTFYDPKLKTVMRWLPAAEDQLEGEEEQKQPLVMDSWYLHHPLLNLSRLALRGDKTARELFLNSLGFAIKVARHFKYKWPVFYKMDTLEVVKAETKPGAGGEKDVAGLYTHVMLQAWELTNDEKYLTEAKKAAKTLEGYGFSLFYQANNTAFSAGALLRLYQLTKEERYLNLCYLCMANIFQNVQLWDCNYGYAKAYPTFFALFPLSDAPYTAVYEEQEVFCAMHDFLLLAQETDILPALKLLCGEYIRFMVDRAPYYYAPMLPREMLSNEVKVGEVDPDLWIALEDIHDGWEQSGQVGQEVYGAGNAFGIVPRHYFKIEQGNFMIYCDYPIARLRVNRDHSLSFLVLGDERTSCRLRILPGEKNKGKFIFFNARKEKLELAETKEGHLELSVSGNQRFTLKWES